MRSLEAPGGKLRRTWKESAARRAGSCLGFGEKLGGSCLGSLRSWEEAAGWRGQSCWGLVANGECGAGVRGVKLAYVCWKLQHVQGIALEASAA